MEKLCLWGYIQQAALNITTLVLQAIVFIEYNVLLNYSAGDSCFSTLFVWAFELRGTLNIYPKIKKDGYRSNATKTFGMISRLQFLLRLLMLFRDPQFDIHPAI